MSTHALKFVERLEGRTLFALAAGFESVRVLRVDGTESPQLTTSMEFSPDGRIFLTDSQDGQVEVIRQDRGTGQWRKNPTPALTLAVDRFRERGLESLVFDPDYASNRYLYVYYSTADPANPNAANNGSRNRLVRYQTRADNPDLVDPASATVLIDDVPTPTGIHNGGAMHFGADGMLYLAIGEGGVGANAQDLSNLNGKVLRLDTGAFNGSGDRADLVPADNPFAGQAGRRGEIWAYGLRNPFTGAIRPGTSTLFLNDVGGSAWEEVNEITRGGNFGWPQSEGMSSDPAHVDPLHAYTHFPNGTSNPRVQAAVTGGVFYEGTQFPAEYRGKYFFADYLRKWIKVLDPATGRVTTLGDGLTGFLDLDVAPDGSLWGLEIGGNLYRIRYVGQANRPPTAAASADRTSGAVPLTVSFSSAGSSDPDGDALTYTWDFGDGQTASGRDVAHTYKRAGRFTARLTVSDGEGGTDASEPITVTAGSSAPSATIGTPTSGALYRGGQTIGFAGSGTDAEDGDLPASAFSWRIVFHHADHDHPFLGPINGVKSGSFRVPTGGEVDPDQWYRIHLTVTDSDGLTRTVNRDVRPRTSRVTLATNVDGLSLRLDGAAVAEGSSFVGVEGMVRSIGAPATQTLNGRTYQFVSWSDGKTATHNVTTPTSDTIYTATYRLTSGTSTTINATAAALVRGGAYANTNFGSATELVVKRHDTSADQVRESYLKFDLSRVTTITSAKLRLYGRLNDTGNPSVRTNIYSASNTSWPEGGLTWNNKPAAGSTLRGSFTASGTTARWYEIDLTSFLRAEKAAGRNLVTLVLKNPIQSASKTVINSDESASNRPQLVVT